MSNTVIILLVQNISNELMNAVVIIFLLGLIAIIPATEIFLSSLKKNNYKGNTTNN